MAIQVKLILPANASNKYLRSTFVNNGNLYFTGQSNSEPVLDQNRNTLRFSFQLEDNATFQPVAFARLVSLQISNDFQFDPTATFTIIDHNNSSTYLPALLNTYDITKDYVVNLNPSYFFNTLNNTLETSREVVAGSGQFVVNNWPLSGNGGISTVYFKAIVQAVNGQESSYPNGYGGYDQIFWQSEKVSTPTVPVPQSILNNSYFGKKSSWKWRSAEESSTGLYGSGVARYVGDILEIRSLIYSTNTSASAYRTFAKSFTAQQISPITYNYSGNSYSQTSNLTLGQTTQLSSGNGLFNYCTNDKINVGDPALNIQPSFGAQSYVKFSCGDTNSIGNLYIKIVNTGEPQNQSSSDEIVLNLQIQSGIRSFATLYRSINGSAWNNSGLNARNNQQVTYLPDSLVADLSMGGNMEIYVSPIDSLTMIAEAYFTAASGKSYLLGKDIVPSFTTTAPYGLSMAVGAFTPNGTINFALYEQSYAAGRYLLDVDLGNCGTEDAGSNLFPVTQTVVWNASNVVLPTNTTATAQWTYKTEGTAATPTVTTNNTYISLVAPVAQDTTTATQTTFSAGGERTVAEIQSVLPTFSNKSSVTWNMSLNDGEFYVALSPYAVVPPPVTNPVTPSKPTMISRCNQHASSQDIPVFQPTIAILFSKISQRIMLVQRKADNSLIVRTLCSYIPLAIDYFTLQINNQSGGTASGCTVTLKRGTSLATMDTVGIQYLTENMMVSEKGLGLYVAMGVRSEPYSSFLSFAYVRNSSANLASVSITGLPVIAQSGFSDIQDGICHFLKSTPGTVVSKVLLGQKLLAGLTDESNYDFSASTKSKTFIQKIYMNDVGSFYNAIAPKLLELKMQATASTATANSSFAFPTVQFFADENGVIDSLMPLSSVIGTYTSPVWNSTGFVVPNSDLVQFNISNFSVPSGTPVWLAVTVPANCSAASASVGNLDMGIANEIFTDVNGNYLPGITDLNAGGGWKIVDSLWFKIFASSVTKHNNVYNGAIQHLRVQAVSHANLHSDPTTLSDFAKVDIVAPNAASHGSADRPIATIIPSVKSAFVNIRAEDADSSLFAFRIGRETDFGDVIFDPWLPSIQYMSENQIKYVVYFHRSFVEGINGLPFATFNSGGADQQIYQNIESIGSRKIWAQVMDNVGNISETYPYTILSQGATLVDTIAPFGNVSFFNPVDKTTPLIKNSSNTWLSLTAYDNISGVKDFRTRTIGAGTISASNWSIWQNIEEFLPYTLPSGDGKKRVEVQYRDYGNNAIQSSGVWDNISHTNNGISTASAVWTPPGASSDIHYSSIIQNSIYTGYNLVDSVDPAYPPATAYYAISNNSSSFGRKISFHSNDQITVFANGSPVPQSTYHIDSLRGVLVFTSQPSTGTLTINITRNSAVVYSWDGFIYKRLFDLDGFGEKVILSMLPTTNYLYMGSGNGNIWIYDGFSVIGPVYTAKNSLGQSLPISFLLTAQFTHEANSYIYAGTANTGRIFRAQTLQANNTSAWNAVTFLDGSVNSDFTSATFSYNKLFIGTKASKIILYQRLAGTVMDTETISVSILKPQDISSFGIQPTSMPVTDMNVVGDLVFASIGNRPEVWSYYEQILSLPQRQEEWTSYIFDSNFIYTSSPWQYYNNGATSTYNSLTGLDNGINFVNIANPLSDAGYATAMQINGSANQVTSLSLEGGSDWEQIIHGHVTWTLEFGAYSTISSGSQGFEISDGRFTFAVNLNPTTIPNSIQIQSGDNIKTVNLPVGVNLNSSTPTQIRVSVNDRDLTLWVGNMSATPLITLPNFLLLSSRTTRIRFGKIYPDTTFSSWVWAGLRFVAGAVVAPVQKNINDFNLSCRFNSTGGVRKLVNFTNSDSTKTLFALTDGIGGNHPADNPDDRSSKVFAYLPSQQVWEQYDPAYPRIANGLGIIRPLTGVQYRDTLMIAGQNGQILYFNDNP